MILSPCQRLHSPLLVHHLRVDLGQLPLQPLDSRPGMAHVRLQEVQVVLGPADAGAAGHRARAGVH